ncbi:hypothetical protein SESBI_03163 [Sesbania bispinosa]|nr:hypothetical protein SESBI_03163 [Sesbania bispinosa]
MGNERLRLNGFIILVKHGYKVEVFPFILNSKKCGYKWRGFSRLFPVAPWLPPGSFYIG